MFNYLKWLNTYSVTFKVPFKKAACGLADFKNHFLPCKVTVHVTSTAMCY